MEKSRAIELLKLAVPIKALTQQEYADFVEAVNMGMDALKAQLSSEGATSDTISRQAALDIFDDYNISVENGELEAYSRDRKRLCELPTAQPVATDINVGDKISKFIDGLEEIFAGIRERHVDDSVCGLCEYDGAYIGQSGDWCNECPGFEKDDCFKLSDKIRKKWTDEIIKALPIAQPERPKGEWIPHKSIFGGLGEKVYTCNQCGYNNGFHTGNFCANCGADMRGESE